MSGVDTSLAVFLGIQRPAMEHPMKSWIVTNWFFPVLFGIVAGIVILLELDPTNQFPGVLQGPGVTVDESLNVQAAVRLATGIPEWIRGGLTTREMFGTVKMLGRENPPIIGFHETDYPPMGRLWLGAFHRLTRGLVSESDFPSNKIPFIVACARVGSAVAFAVLVILVGIFTAQQFDRRAGIFASLSLVLMPRLFGHAHLASIETLVCLTSFLTIFWIGKFWTTDDSPPMKHVVIAGLFLGLAFLTKINAILLPIPIVFWTLWHFRKKGIVPAIVLGGVSLLTFFVGWPWLWFAPIEHFKEYFFQATERVSIMVFYFGEKLADRDVPFHYPLVYFLVTVPVGLHFLGFYGLAAVRGAFLKNPIGCLLICCLIFPLLLFSLPGIVVYDGMRLFVSVFPLWAVVIGYGGSQLYNKLKARMSQKKLVWGCVVFFALHGVGLVTLRPCYLSYYNMLTGGLWGAEKLGMEPTYWGDSITADILEEAVDRIPPNVTLEFAPVLHPVQLPNLLDQSSLLRRRRIKLVAYSCEDSVTPSSDSRYVLCFLRKSYLPEELIHPANTVEVLASVKQQGVTLAVLYRFR